MPNHRPKRFEPYGTSAERRKRYDQARVADPTYNKKFYSSAAWRKVRAEKLRRNPFCECEAHRDQAVPATVVDHVIDRRARPDLALDLANLQSLAKACHDRKTAREHLNRHRQKP